MLDRRSPDMDTIADAVRVGFVRCQAMPLAVTGGGPDGVAGWCKIGPITGARGV